VPAGLHYERVGARWHAVVRFGRPIYLVDKVEIPRIEREVENQVRLLSQPVLERAHEGAGSQVTGGQTASEVSG
jgi:hypothetical protein